MQVLLLEKMTIGAGPTGQSSAIIRQHYSNELTARMAKFSLGIFQNFSEIYGGECGFTNTGFLILKTGYGSIHIAHRPSPGIVTRGVLPTVRRTGPGTTYVAADGALSSAGRR